LPEFILKNAYFDGEYFIPPILNGVIDEFFHVFRDYSAAVGLRIPIKEIKDIDFAIKEANRKGFDAKVIETKEGYRYLKISKQYKTEDDLKVVKELKNLAIEISKENYSDHIKSLPLKLKTKKHNMEKDEVDEQRASSCVIPSEHEIEQPRAAVKLLQPQNLRTL